MTIDPSSERSRKQDALIMWGYILAALEVLCCCCPGGFALVSLVLGIVAYVRGDQRGKWVILVAIIILILSGTLKLTGTWQKQLHQWIPPEYQGPWVNI